MSKDEEECNKKYYYYNVESSPYLLFYLEMRSCGINPTIKKFNETLDNLIVFFADFKNIAKEFQELITEEEINELMELPLAKKAINIIASESQIKLLNINAKNKFYNSFSFLQTNIIISICCRGENKIDKVQVFLHELGHLLYGFIERKNLFKDIEFEYVIKHAIHNKWDAIPEKDMLEVFADCFSVACMSGTKFENRNFIFRETPDEKARVKITTDYFENLMYRLSNYSIL